MKSATVLKSNVKQAPTMPQSNDNADLADSITITTTAAMRLHKSCKVPYKVYDKNLKCGRRHAQD